MPLRERRSMAIGAGWHGLLIEMMMMMMMMQARAFFSLVSAELL